MKKFLIFLTVVIVAVSIGLTTYYFLRNDEVISFSPNEIYCNVGDIIELDDLGYKVTKKSRKTTYNFNAGGEEVTTKIVYDTSKGYYVAKAGGDTEIVITTSNKGFKNFKIAVHIGDGDINPYYIDSQSDLEKIGSENSLLTLSKKYQLLKSFSLNGEFAPIGAKTQSAFAGSFDGHGYTITGLTQTGAYANAGLFYGLANTASVKDLTIENATISGAYEKTGALAGFVDGKVERVAVVNANITNSTDFGLTGGLAGQLTQNANIYMTSATGVVNGNGANAVVGGLVGENNQGNILATYARTTIGTTTTDSVAGGLVGKFVIGTTSGAIQQSYAASNASATNFGSFIGTLATADGFDAEDKDFNVLKYLIGNYTEGEQANVVKNDTTELYKEYGFLNEEKTIYFVIASDIKAKKDNTEFIYYALDANEKTPWDANVWDIVENTYPNLQMTETTIPDINNQYFLKDLQNTDIGSEYNTEQENREAFKKFIEERGGQIKDESYTLQADINLNGENWDPITLTHGVFNGNGHKIYNFSIDSKNINAGFFSTVTDSYIGKLTLEVNDFKFDNNGTSYVGILAGKTEKSTIQDVNVKVTNEIANSKAYYMGGITGQLVSGTITGGLVEFKLAESTTGAIVGGVAGVNNGTIEDIDLVDVVLYSTNVAGGVAGVNNGTVQTVSTKQDGLVIKFSINATSNSGVYGGNVYIGGVVGYNKYIVRDILDDTYNIDIAYDSKYETRTVRIGGVTGKNESQIENVFINGGSIDIASTVGETVYVGGIAGENNYTIKHATAQMERIGNIGKNVYTGGIAAIDAPSAQVDASIYQCRVTTHIYGNYAAGIVVKVTNANSIIDQVLVRDYVGRNTISGDKYVAGAVVEMGNGTNGLGLIKNIQLASNINAANKDAKTSLIALIFPAGAKLQYATVNSIGSGDGVLYQETWVDYGSNKDGFNYTTKDNQGFNIFASDGISGVMQNVVINTEVIGKNVVKGHFIEAFLSGLTYSYTSNSSFVRELDSAKFNKTDYFQGSYTWCVPKQFIAGNRYGSENLTGNWKFKDNRFSWTLTFDTDSVWSKTDGQGVWNENDGQGITLTFDRVNQANHLT